MKNILATILGLFINQILFSQNLTYKNLYSLYQNEKLEELRFELNKIENNKSSEIEFYNSLFMENGEEALQKYLNIFEKSYGELKSIVSKKLSDYYYAKGYYLTAAKYQKFLVESTDSKPSQQNNNSVSGNNTKYIIQLGAFAQKENAVQLKEMLQTQNLYTRIEERNINGNDLHCVWMEGKKGFSETLEFAEKIKEKYHLQYRILQQ